MCGIVGFIKGGGTASKLKDYLNFAGLLVTIRGSDGSGAGYAWGNNQSGCINSHLSSGDLIRSQVSDNTIKGKLSGNKAVFVHTRAATVGNVVVENTHPFEVGDMIFCHNGTLEAGYEDVFPDIKDFATDSEWLGTAIATHGLEDVVSKVRGAMSLVWINKTDGTMNFYRNGQRPMIFGLTMDNDVLFASTKQILTGACAAAAVVPIGIDDTPVNKHISIDINTAVVSVGDSIEQPPARSYNRYSNYSNDWRSSRSKSNNKTPSKKKVSTKTDEERLCEIGTLKEIGDECILLPNELSRVTSRSKSGLLKCTHGFQYEDTVISDTPFPAAVFQIDVEVAEFILDQGLLLIGEIEAVTNKGTVKIKKTNLKLLDVSGRRDMNMLHDKLYDECPNAYRHFPMVETPNIKLIVDNTSKDDDIPYDEQLVRQCSSCSETLTDGWETESEDGTETYYACCGNDGVCKKDIELYLLGNKDKLQGKVQWRYFVESAEEGMPW